MEDPIQRDGQTYRVREYDTKHTLTREIECGEYRTDGFDCMDRIELPNGHRACLVVDDDNASSVVGFRFG